MLYQPFSLKIRATNLFSVTVFCVCTLFLLRSYTVIDKSVYYEKSSKEIVDHERLVAQFYGQRRDWKTSKLGGILFKNEKFPKKKNKTFNVLIYKHFEKIKNRHLYYFGSTRKEPLEGCSVDNCVFTGNDKDITTADAVVVHLHRGNIPKVNERKINQRWIFLDDESPRNTFALASKRPTLDELAGIFNWSMTYRSDADIPVPYGRTVALKSPKRTTRHNFTQLIPNWKEKKKDVLVSILMSNCGVKFRNQLIKGLSEHIEVHVHGNCGGKEFKRSCPGHFKADCPLLSKYLFYLVIENGKCKEYITEKLFNNAYSKGAIPIIQGPSIEDCEKLLPPNSYLHFDYYNSMKDLADDIVKISNDKAALMSYHRWRRDYDVLNEHGYFGTKSFHLCRLCEALNYNNQGTSIYGVKELKRFLDPSSLCRN